MSEVQSPPLKKCQPPDRGLVRLGRRLFPQRLFIGLGAVLPALFLVRPQNPFGRYQALGTGVSLALVLMGLGLRAWAASKTQGHTRTEDIEAPALTTAGPYSHVRNPIYLGSIVLGLGMVGLIGDPRMLVLYAGTFGVLYFGIIPAEEQFLEHKFGSDYACYRAAVPRLVPRWRPWPGAREAPSDWRLARGDAGIGLILVAIYTLLRLAAYFRGVCPWGATAIPG